MLFLQRLALGLIIVGIGMCGYYISKGMNQKAVVTVPSKYGSIVRLTREGRTFCSGTVISSSLIITAAHCVMEETPFGLMISTRDIEVRPRNNTDLRVEAATVYASHQMDSAVLHGDFSDFNNRELITDPAILTNIRSHTTKFISCGYPLGGDLYCNYTSDPFPDNFAWKVSGVLIPGMSGGPTMLEDGTVVAINIAVEREHAVVSPTYNLLSFIKEQK